MKTYGLTREDVINPEVEILVWPEHWQTMELFDQLRTQWCTGFNGPTGIDYSVLPFIFKVNRIKKKQQWPRYVELRIMEDAALKVMKKSSK